MSTAQTTASPRASRGKQQPSSQRKPRGNRANNVHGQHNAPNASPRRPPNDTDTDLASPDSAGLSSPDAQAQPLPRPRHPKKHTHSQPSIDRVVSDKDAAPANPSATPVKIQGAYAGPTFHASPAPSALPIPKFLSRSVPAKTRVGPPTPPPDDSSDSANSPSPPIASPSRAPVFPPGRHQDSPLDLFFKADKAEKARNLHGSPVSASFCSPPMNARPPHYQHDSFHSINGVFPIELDSQTKDANLSSSPAGPSGASSRAVTDPGKVPQLKDASASANGNDIMQDLFKRLSMSQKKIGATMQLPVDGPSPSEPHSRHLTPSPFKEGRTTVRSASGPSTPAPLNHETSDIFYGNRNLSPLFQAAKGDAAKRNSGLRTEITADSPLLSQGMFPDFPSVPPSGTFSRAYPGSGNEGPAGQRRGSVPIIQPHQGSPNNRRRVPTRPAHQPRPDSYPARTHPNGPHPRAGAAASKNPVVTAPKPSTTMMSFVPASVAAKQRSAPTPPSTSTPPLGNSTPSDPTALEQDLKRLLNLKTTADAPVVR